MIVFHAIIRKKKRLYFMTIQERSLFGCLLTDWDSLYACTHERLILCLLSAYVLVYVCFTLGFDTWSALVYVGYLAIDFCCLMIHTHTHTHVCVCVCLDGSSLCYSFQFCPICRCLDGLPKKLKCIWLLIILVLQRQENSVYSSSNKISRKEIRDKPSIGAKKQRKKNRLKLN